MMKKRTKYLEQLNNEFGFTLIEMLITITIVAIAAGISGFGLNSVFGANMDSMTQEIATEFRDLRFRSTSEIDTDYMFLFTHDSTSDKYGYVVYRREEKTDGTYEDPEEFRSVDYPSYLRLYQYDPSDADSDTDLWEEMSDPVINVTANPESGSFAFKTLTGGISSKMFYTDDPYDIFNGDTITSLQGIVVNADAGVTFDESTDDDIGKYKIVNTRTGEEKEFEIIGYTGRVVSYD